MHFISCWAITCAGGILLPWLIGWLLLISGFQHLASVMFCFQALSGLVAGGLLYRDLARRRFL
jgi:hypothetical protein